MSEKMTFSRVTSYLHTEINAHSTCHVVLSPLQPCPHIQVSLLLLLSFLCSFHHRSFQVSPWFSFEFSLTIVTFFRFLSSFSPRFFLVINQGINTVIVVILALPLSLS